MSSRATESVKSVLIVEDDEELRPLLRAVLVAQGHRVHEAGTKSAALAVLSRTSVEVAVIDGMLPDGDALDLARDLRRVPAPPELVFLASAARLSAISSMLEPLGVGSVLEKPVQPALLSAAVARALGVPETEPSASAVALDRVLEELRDRSAAYARTLSAKLRELRASLEAARTAGVGSDSYREAQARAHRLHGTAGTFGFVEVSEAGKLIEHTLDSLFSGGQDAQSAWALIDDALSRIEIAPSSARRAFPSTGPKGPLARILVIDDDAEFLQGLSSAATSVSLEVIGASDPAAALELARTEAVDAIFIDMRLGGGWTGAGVAFELSRIPALKPTPLVAISADSSLENRLAAVQAGTSVFLAKPIDGDELVACMQRIMDRTVREKFRILVIDDDPLFAAAAGRLLCSAGWEVATLADVERLFDVLGDVRPDLLLLDLMMPVSGFDVCKIIRASPIWQDLPIVFLTGATDHDTLVSCYAVGGDDYVKKPILPDELLARVRLRLERARMLRQRAFEDGLTGLLTRAAFSDVVGQRLSEAARRKRPLSIALLDVDSFKQINDTYGHLAGDRVLRGLGRLLRTQFRAEDVRARWGGEEFAIACYEEGAAATAIGIDRALNEFRSMVFHGDRGELFSGTFSGGIACFPQDGTTLDGLMRSADARLYSAKRAGRNRVVFQSR